MLITLSILMKKIITFIFLLALLTLQSCGVYSFTGVNIGDAETVQIDYFQNNAQVVEPIASQKFTEALQDLFQRQTSLKPVRAGGDLHFEGEITEFRTIPISATAEQTAAQNRLNMSIRVRFYNKKKPDDDFDKTFSFFSDFDANQQLTGTVLEDALNTIYERITQDILNDSVAKW